MTADCNGTVSSHFRGGAGTPLALLHPITTSWRVWRPVLPALTARHDVFAPTLAGHRGGPVFADGQRARIGTITDLVERDLAAAGLGTVHVAGNSLGGAISLELARRGRARSVVAISPGGYVPSSRAIRQVGALLELTRRAIVCSGVSRMAGGPRRLRALLWVGLRHGERVPLDDVVEDMKACEVIPVLLEEHVDKRGFDPLSVPGVPIRIAWAQHDWILPWRRFGAPLVKQITGAEVIMLPGVGHTPMYDDPHLVADTILRVTTAVDEQQLRSRQHPLQ
jgi:pimeloyl-ACP methyl ester carboxylesterase